MLLMGRVWEVKEMFPAQKQVLVVPAKEARNVMFLGGGLPEMHQRIAQRVREILVGEDAPRYLSAEGQSALANARRLSREIGLNDRQIFETGEEWAIFPWTGTRAARALQFILSHGGLEPDFPNTPWVMTFKREGDSGSLQRQLRRLAEAELNPAEVMAKVPLELLRGHKHDEFLPEALLRAQAAEEWIDWEEGRRALASLLTD